MSWWHWKQNKAVECNRRTLFNHVEHLYLAFSGAPEWIVTNKRNTLRHTYALTMAHKVVGVKSWSRKEWINYITSVEFYHIAMTFNNFIKINDMTENLATSNCRSITPLCGTCKKWSSRTPFYPIELRLDYVELYFLKPVNSTTFYFNTIHSVQYSFSLSYSVFKFFHSNVEPSGEWSFFYETYWL